MNKQEFLREIKNGLCHELTDDEVSEILADYNDIIDEKIAEGSDGLTAVALAGSPANIIRTILMDSVKQTGQLATIPKRLGAHVVDTIVTTLLLCTLFFSAILIHTNVAVSQMDSIIPLSGVVQRTVYYQDGNIKYIKLFVDGNLLFKTTERSFEYTLEKFGLHKADVEQMDSITYVHPEWIQLHLVTRFALLLSLIVTLGIGNIMNAFVLWISKGFTLGKWLFHIKVVRTDGKALTLGNILLRDVAVKILFNAVTLGCLNLVSFIRSVITLKHKTIHDLAAQTKVIEVGRQPWMHN